MTIPLIIAGLILRLTSGWFHAQHTVGDICLWVGAIGLALQLILWLCVGAALFASDKPVKYRPSPPLRRGRGFRR